jgi:two-component system, OmpR family, alkaline phosphatase synthesis response regulator PhoP
MQRVLVVEDEKSIRTLVEYTLTQAGFQVFTADNGLDVSRLVQDKQPHIMILDLMIPGINGMEVCQRLRREGVTTPVIMLTARDEEVDRILGLEMGADDYVTKPFSPRELLARVRAVLRRTGNEAIQTQSPSGTFHIGDIFIDVNKYEVSVAGLQVELTAREFELLVYLARHLDHVLHRNQLLEHVWGYEFSGDTRIVDVHISHLREKLEKDAKVPDYIKTVRGVGYKLTRS